MLKLADKICTENKLTYFLVGGTLLGAIRHKGFIPWDDDLDIALPREDYNKFISLCSNGALGDGYFLQHTMTMDDYWLPFAKIRKNGTLFDEPSTMNINCHKGIFIDVFPLDFSKREKGLLYNVKAKTVKKLSNVIKCRGLHSPSDDFLTKLCILLTKMIPIKKLSAIRDSFAASCKQGSYLIGLGSNYKYQKQTMPVSYYLPPCKVQFEDAEFMAPGCPIKYLEHLFSAWEKLPPENERLNHNPANISFNE